MDANCLPIMDRWSYKDGVAIAQPRRVKWLRKFDQLCAGNVLSQIVGVPDFDYGIARSMYYECRHMGGR